ncbi:MAG: PDZ domain-containing protein, partial [Pseudomonadota bacterium]
TSGIVSALGRSGIGAGYEDFIQTDASINPGNSGGALVNLAGELVGINSAIISRSGGNVGIGFAIPSNMATSIMRQLIDFGEVRRGLLGVSIETVNAQTAEIMGLKNISGAMVASVTPGSAAEKAGIEVSDIITAVNGEKVDSANELRNAIGLLRSGDSVTVTALRDGKVQRFNAQLGELNARLSANAGDLHAGLEGATFEDDNGVRVVSVEEDSPAFGFGLRAGDRVIAVNRQRVNSLSDFRNITSTFSNNPIFIEIERDGRSQLRKFVP